ncbi:MAG: penicillin-binding protein 1B [Gammaproteobacteria bacterium]|jgi:penicillin-binding protein 1B
MALKKTKKSNQKYVSKINIKHKYNVSLVFRFMIICISLLAAYVILLDYRIHNEFEGRRWSLPARVYSHAVDIYIGQEISLDQLEQLLLSNNYRQSFLLSGPGEYSKSVNKLNVYLRDFDYWDGRVQSIQYQIEFNNGVISRILDMDTKLNTVLLRIEPKLIGKIYPDHNEDRVMVKFDDIPPFLLNALITVEDRNFYHHHGIEFKAIFRAFLVNVRNGELSQGGSTLTQQLVKNFFLTQERTFSRKINEVIMALLLELRYQKTEILSAYINEVYLGQNGSYGIHGFGTAAEFYFNKPLSELREDQLALLTGMVQGASYYNPRRSPENAKSRRNLVLRLMMEQGFMDQLTLALLQNYNLDVTDPGDGSFAGNQAFMDIAKRQLLSDYDIDDLKNEGLKIYTTMDIRQQQNLNTIVSTQLSALERQRNLQANSLEAASIVINPVNGEILAINGGRNSALSGFNRALDARRPIGSLIKPFIYLTALLETENYSLLTGLDDNKISITQEDGSSWSPDNYDKTEHGKVSLLEAIINSYNLATVRLGMDVGLDKVISTLHVAGLDGDINAYPSLLLGSLELSPFEVTQIYQTLANSGYKVQLNSIEEVLDDKGSPLQRRNLKVYKSLNEQAVYLVNFILKKVVEIGTARQLLTHLGSGIQLAGKTGTTNDSRDSWFAGFSDNILAVTWVGRDDNKSTPLTGASGAMKIWAEMMRVSGYSPLILIDPENISWTESTSLQFNNECINFGQIPYVENNVPENDLKCPGIGVRLKSIFNIRELFQ